MPNSPSNTESENKTDDKPAKDEKPVVRKNEQKTFGAPGIERQK